MKSQLEQFRQFLYRMYSLGYLTSAAGVALNRLTQVLIQILLARILTGPDYSSFYFHFAAITGLSMFIGDGIGLASSRLLSSQTGTAAPRIISLAVIAGFIASFCAALLVATHLFLSDSEPVSKLLLTLLIVYSFSLSFLSVLQYIMICIGQKAYLAKTQIAFSALSLILTLSAASRWGWSAALISLLVCVLGSNILLLKKAFRYQDFLKVIREDLGGVTQLIKNALPICGSMALGGPVHVYCLSILKSSTADRPNELGVFGLSFVTYTIVSFIPGAFGQFLVPWLLKNEKLSTKDAFKYVTKLYAVAGFFILIVIFIANGIGFDGFLPTIAKGEKSIYLLAGTGLLGGFIALYSYFLNAIYKSHFVLFSTIYYSVSYILLTTLLVQHLNWGAVGLSCSILASSAGQLFVLSYIKKGNE
ncbi:MAG: hypothetical protein H7328_01750 [Bdellovibrio sp.]|nr:hypothetical protein [Bdellovibrio sp.]